ncbi:Retrieval of early ER protein Rer1 [Ostreococcus tauri]|uniref:Protein RER1 n=1 Tax=Ostreococcus tauri TaxID=70448 RepID=Q00W53_OSTTA|nr:Retrieval of early ER protein Rer1 [Ostreococcus tauri]OUS45925.1 Golgi protein [Ostreococcus tauri]CAL56905.1 Retrieval of early ER protein Rer1 [Ostreococcus tauri]|eukprot:XP_003082950.1 Retrieval of early ER protein Rer1 [Ostreococcus tauri]
MANVGESYAYGASTDASSSPFAKAKAQLERRVQTILDRSVPFIAQRWSFYAFVAFVYAVRAYFLKGYYIVTYGLGIYNLNLLIGFLSPQRDPESLRSGNDGQDGPSLPTRNEQEFKPFVRRLPEFKFWWMSLKSIGTAFCMTFCPVFDVPVFWPILLMYFFMLFFMTMKQQVKHMIKHKYVPFTTGKPTFGGGSSVGASGLQKNSD